MRVLAAVVGLVPLACLFGIEVVGKALFHWGAVFMGAPDDGGYTFWPRRHCSPSVVLQTRRGFSKWMLWVCDVCMLP